MGKKYQIEREPGVTDYNLRFKKVLEEAHRQTGLRAVVLVDEYDKPLLDVMDTGYMVEHLGEQITLEEKTETCFVLSIPPLREPTSICNSFSSPVLLSSRR